MPMPSEPSANDERFNRRESTRAMLEAVSALCEKTGRTLDHMELLTMREICDLAEDTYVNALPEFWRVWLDWHGPNDAIQPMGEL